MPIHREQGLVSVNDYHRMGEKGILTEEDRVELLRGKIMEMSPTGSEHAACVEKISALLREHLKYKRMVRTQNPIILNAYSEPEPDLLIVTYKENYYADQHPQPKEVFLVIEVADSSLEKDRIAKAQLYAKAAIPEYWIVNLEVRQLECFLLPLAGEYQEKKVYSITDTISSEELSASLPVLDFFPA